MVGFIGTGNMASAILKGAILSGRFRGSDIGVFDLDSEKVNNIVKTHKVSFFSSAAELAAECRVVVLSVKPNVIASVLAEIGEVLKEKSPLVISIAAGKSLEFLSSCLSYEAKLVRVMPNINAVALSAVSGYCCSEKVSEGEKTFVNDLLSSFGEAFEIKEELFPIYSAIAGCSPAFSYMYVDSLAKAAVKNGMPRDMALKISAAAVMGSAKMIMESDEHPLSLVDKVCSPGGTTIEGVASLYETAFEDSVIKAVEASYNKDKKM